MSNSNTVPWLVAVIATAIGAGAIGFFARPMILGESAAPAAQQQAAGGEAALPPGTTTEKFDAWTLICSQTNDPAKPICFATQESHTPEGQLILATLAGYNEQAQRTFLVRAPLGVQLDNGLIFQMGDDKPVAFAFSSCSQVSCDAQLIIPDGNFGKLEAAGSFNLAYMLADGTPVRATISMMGLGKAYEKIIKPEVKPAPAADAPAATPAPDAPAAGSDTPTPTPKPATE